MDLPTHLAIIMDGNGRWATLRHKPRAYGHIKGTRVAKTIITEASRMGIKYLTLYAFSTENWYRPQKEVTLLMRILLRYLQRETANLVKENIRLKVIGDISRVPAEIEKALFYSINATRNCTGLQLVFALSYGSRQEIVQAVKQIADEAKRGNLDPEQIDEKFFAHYLTTKDIPDPDLIIRTSGEMRLSNFLLWQAAYSEFYFSDTLWPDFSKNLLIQALRSYSERHRRFGKIDSEVIHS